MKIERRMKLEAQFKHAGYEVLVFIASNDEDAGRITCGNATLSGTMPHRFEDITNPCR